MSALQEALIQSNLRERQAISKTRIRGEPGDSAQLREIGASRRSLIGPYHLEKEIGRGGMSTVYKAWDRRTDTCCALKVLRSAISGEGTSALRFRREVETVRSIEHDHVVPILDHGSDSGASYIAMPLIEGQTVGELVLRSAEWSTALDQGDDRTVATAVTRALPDSEGWWDPRGEQTTEERFRAMTAAMAPIADALQMAHEKGILHRDVKPSNLLHDAEGKLWLTDFGLASATEAQTVVTHSGQILGTPNYMSPEQAKGVKDLDARTDIYSLGATLYECVTVRKPYRGDSFRVLLDIASGKLTPPSHWKEDLPPNLEAIILKAMAFSPNDRYQSSADLAADLRRFAKGRPTVARLPGLADKAIRMISRHPGSFALGAGVLLLLLTVATVGQSIIASQQRWKRDRTEQRNETLRGMIDELNKSQLRLRRQSYATDLPAAFNAYQNRDSDAAQQFLKHQLPNDVDTDLRRSEWWLLNNLTRPLTSTRYDGHSAAVREARLIGVRDEVISTGDDATLRRWTVAGIPLGRPIMLESKADALAVSPSGDRVYVGQNSEGTTLNSEIHFLESGRPPLRLTAHESSIESAAFSPQGDLIVTADRYGELILHDTDGRLIGRDEAGSRNESVLFTRDGKFVVGIWRNESDGGRRQSLRFWSAIDMSPAKTVTLLDLSPHHVDLAANDAIAVLANRDKFVLVDLRSEEPMVPLVSVRGGIRTVDLTPDGDRLAIGCDNGLLYQWDIQRVVEGDSWKVRLSDPLVLPLGTKKLTSVRFADDGEVLVASEDGQVRKCRPRLARSRFCEFPQRISAIARLTDEAGGVYARAKDGAVYRFDPENRSIEKIVDVPDDPYVKIAFSPLHRQLALGVEDQVWLCPIDDLDHPKKIPLGVPEKSVRFLRFSPDESTLEVLLNDRILLMDPQSDGEIREIMLPREGAISLSVTKDNRTLVVTTNEELIFLDASSYRVKHRVIREGSLMTEATQFSESGKLLACCHEDGTIRVHRFDPANRKLTPFKVLRGHRDSVLDLIFLDRDQTLVSVSCDGTLRFWDVPLGRELGKLPTTEGVSQCLHYDPIRKLLMTCSPDLPIRIYSTAREGE